MLGQYRAAFILQFRAAVEAVTKLEKVDAESLAPIFQAPLLALSQRALEYHGALADEVEADAPGLAAMQLKALVKRSAKWSVATPDELAKSEFLKVVRSIHVNAARETGATRALKQLATEDEVQDEA